MKLWLTRPHALNTPRNGFRGFTLWVGPPVYDMTELEPGRVIGWRMQDGDATTESALLYLPPGNVPVGKSMDHEPALIAQRDAAWALMWSQLPDSVFTEGVGWHPTALWDFHDAEPHEHSRFCVEIDGSPAFWVASMMRMSDRECEAHAWGQALCELPF